MWTESGRTGDGGGLVGGWWLVTSKSTRKWLRGMELGMPTGKFSRSWAEWCSWRGKYLYEKEAISLIEFKHDLRHTRIPDLSDGTFGDSFLRSAMALTSLKFR
jgi:hypothetical protein